MKYSKFATLKARYKSFATWKAKSSIHEMINAGFFYSGKLDLVYCFHCGIALDQWEEDDNPRIEHLKWSKYCYYINNFNIGVNVFSKRDIIFRSDYDFVCAIRDEETEEKIQIKDIFDVVSDHPPRLKRRNTL